jgi:hypothetical protein
MGKKRSHSRPEKSSEVEEFGFWKAPACHRLERTRLAGREVGIRCKCEPGDSLSVIARARI